MADERTGVPDRGAALQLELFVDDVLTMCQHIASQGWPLAAYYWRVTARREKGTEP
jgi:hypothetical protein